MLHSIDKGSFNGRHFLSLLGAAGVASLLSEAPASGAPTQLRKPNIIVILADDLGYGELGCYGGRDAPTPNLDGMARAGVRFTSGYVTCPVCSPTRAGLLTGRYQQRFGHENNIGQSWQIEHPEWMGLPVEEKTLADRLRAAGYRTAAIGKWHLGVHENYHPQARGFDEFFGFLEGGRAYLPDDDPANYYLRAIPPHKKVHFRQAGKAPIYRGRDIIEEREYLTDAFTREAIGFVDRSKDRPFFLYLAYNAVHTPITPCPRWEARLRHIENPVRRTVASMTAAMDEEIGKLRLHLRKTGLADHTLLIFLSDNGGSPGGIAKEARAAPYSLNTPLRGHKGQCWEGGIRIPYIVEWPGRIKGGVTSDLPVSSLDIVPTALAAAGAALPETCDGVNLLPFLDGASSGVPHHKLFWRFHVYRAVRVGPMKLLKIRGQPDQLYDLVADLTESRDLAADRPDVVAALNKKLAEWERRMVPPRWNQRFPLTPDGKPMFPRKPGLAGAARPAQVTRARNLLRNGDAETPQPGRPWPVAWYRSESGVKWSTEKAASPTHSLCLEGGVRAPGQVAAWRSLAVDVVPGRAYELSWAWRYEGAREVAAHLRFFATDGKFISQEHVVANGSVATFEAQRIGAIAPAGAATADVCFRKSPGAAGTVFVDDIVLREMNGRAGETAISLHDTVVPSALADAATGNVTIAGAVGTDGVASVLVRVTTSRGQTSVATTPVRGRAFRCTYPGDFAGAPPLASGMLFADATTAEDFDASRPGCCQAEAALVVYDSRQGRAPELPSAFTNDLLDRAGRTDRECAEWPTIRALVNLYMRSRAARIVRAGRSDFDLADDRDLAWFKNRLTLYEFDHRDRDWTKRLGHREARTFWQAVWNTWFTASNDHPLDGNPTNRAPSNYRPYAFANDFSDNLIMYAMRLRVASPLDDNLTAMVREAAANMLAMQHRDSANFALRDARGKQETYTAGAFRYGMFENGELMTEGTGWFVNPAHLDYVRGGVFNGRSLWALGESLKHDPHGPLAPRLRDGIALGVKFCLQDAVALGYARRTKAGNVYWYDAGEHGYLLLGMLAACEVAPDMMVLSPKGQAAVTLRDACGAALDALVDLELPQHQWSVYTNKDPIAIAALAAGVRLFPNHEHAARWREVAERVADAWIAATAPDYPAPLVHFGLRIGPATMTFNWSRLTKREAHNHNTIHFYLTGHWIHALADLYALTGEARYRRRAEAMVSYLCGDNPWRVRIFNEIGGVYNWVDDTDGDGIEDELKQDMYPESTCFCQIGIMRLAEAVSRREQP